MTYEDEKGMMKTAKDFALQALRFARRSARLLPIKQAECGAAVSAGAAECRNDREHGFRVDSVAVARRMALGAARAARYTRFGSKRGVSLLGARDAVLMAYHSAGYASAIKDPMEKGNMR